MSDSSSTDCLPRGLYHCRRTRSGISTGGREGGRECVCIHVHVCVCLCLRVCVCVCVCVRERERDRELHVHVHTESYMYMYMKALSLSLSLSQIQFPTYFSFTDGRLVLSNTTAVLPWLPDSAPSSGSTLRETEVMMAWEFWSISLSL